MWQKNVLVETNQIFCSIFLLYKGESFAALNYFTECFRACFFTSYKKLLLPVYKGEGRCNTRVVSLTLTRYITQKDNPSIFPHSRTTSERVFMKKPCCCCCWADRLQFSIKREFSGRVANNKRDNKWEEIPTKLRGNTKRAEELN